MVAPTSTSVLLLLMRTTALVLLLFNLCQWICFGKVSYSKAYCLSGAVMYLFEGEFGCVLYTGDFRWEAESERSKLAKKALLGALRGSNVDTLYMDNTYCHPSFSFPSREEAAQQMVDIIKLHPNHDIVIGIDTLGKEDLLVRISEALNTKIWVWPERLQTMHVLGYEDIFTTKTCLTRVRAVPRYSLTYDSLEALNTVHPTIGIMPSGLPWGVKPFEENNGLPHLSGLSSNEKARDKNMARTVRAQIQSCKKLQHFAYSVPYSEHSCFGELENFIMSVKPSIVIGIVSSSFCYINPRHYFSHLCRTSQHLHSNMSDNKDSKGETIEVMQSQFVLANKKSSKIRTRKEVNFKVGTPSECRSSTSSGCRSRVLALRREKSGAKIVDSSGIFSSMSSD